MSRIRISHRPSGTLIAEGPRGWGITPFEGNYYIRRKHLKSDGFRNNFRPGLCIYKFLYVWLDFVPADGPQDKSLGWMYWLPNPVFPFIAYRVAVPQHHPSLDIEIHEDAAIDTD